VRLCIDGESVAGESYASESYAGESSKAVIESC